MQHLTDIIKTDDIKLRKALQILEESLCAFSEITGIPVTFFSPESQTLWECGRERKVCVANAGYHDQESSCMLNLRSAMKTAYSLGDVYIYVCNTGLINMCYAFVYEKRLLGYFNAGPIAMGKNKSRTISQFYEKVQEEVVNLPRLMSLAAEMQMRSPKEVTWLSTLYLNAMGSPFVDMGEPGLMRQQSAEQSQIGTKIIEMKKSKIEIKYPLMQEKNFVQSIRNGNTQVSKKLFSEYLGELMVFEGGNISVIKMRLLTLLAKIFHYENSGSTDYRSISQMEAINNASTFAQIHSNANSIIELITGDIARRIYSGDSAIVMQALDFIRKHYNEDINLKRIAGEIHVNNTYLSTLFKKEMGTSIVDYINELRLEAAAEALENTGDSITEIALSSGFKELSYFTKLFKGKYGKTPRQYRSEQK